MNTENSGDDDALSRIYDGPLQDVKFSFAQYRAAGPNGRKTIFTNGPSGWVDAGPVDV